MKILDPNRVAFDLATQHCPLCAERVVREKVVGGVPAGFQRILASCIACDFEQLVQWGDGEGPQHAPQTVVRDESLPATAGRRSAMGESPTIHRPHCVVPGCARLAAENLLCNPHWVEWKNSGEPDRASWVAQHTASRGQQLAERRGSPHATPKGQRCPERRRWNSAGVPAAIGRSSAAGCATPTTRDGSPQKSRRWTRSWRTRRWPGRSAGARRGSIGSTSAASCRRRRHRRQRPDPRAPRSGRRSPLPRCPSRRRRAMVTVWASSHTSCSPSRPPGSSSAAWGSSSRSPTPAAGCCTRCPRREAARGVEFRVSGLELRVARMGESRTTRKVRPVPGFPHYRVWDDGVVESCRRSRRIVPWYPLKPQANKDRYQAVTLRREGRSITRCVHRIALEAFVGPRPEGMQACHADGNSRNNRLENLRWDTAKANTADANRHGRIPRGSRNGRAKLSEWQIVEILRLYAAGVRVAEIAAPFDISPSTVSQIAAGRRWAHVQGVRS